MRTHIQHFQVQLHMYCVSSNTGHTVTTRYMIFLVSQPVSDNRAGSARSAKPRVQQMMHVILRTGTLVHYPRLVL